MQYFQARFPPTTQPNNAEFTENNSEHTQHSHPLSIHWPLRERIPHPLFPTLHHQYSFICIEQKHPEKSKRYRRLTTDVSWPKNIWPSSKHTEMAPYKSGHSYWLRYSFTYLYNENNLSHTGSTKHSNNNNITTQAVSTTGCSKWVKRYHLPLQPWLHHVCLKPDPTSHQSAAQQHKPPPAQW